MRHKTFSVVCPVYNEEAYIDQLLEFISTATVVPDEVFIIDGGSTDGTLEKLLCWKDKLPMLKILHNEDQYVPHALNLAIPLCSGEYIIRLDAHTHYEADYFEQIIKTFRYSKADIIGGPMRTVGHRPFQKAVAFATVDWFAVGNSQFHFQNFKGYTDSVYLGAWKRNIFSKTGLFDEQLIRNQDDEFHYRAKANGFKIFQDPEIRLKYYPRDSVQGLFRQYFQYGLYKPLVFVKVCSGARVRHFVPALFVLYLLSLPFLIYWNCFFLFPLFIYIALLFYKAFSIPAPFKVRLYAFLVYPVIHIGYGLGFLMGIPKINFGGKR